MTIFGSARARPGTYVYDEVKRVAAVLGEMGCDIITGGGPGLMQAANEGAAEVIARWIGVDSAKHRNRAIGEHGFDGEDVSIGHPVEKAVRST